MKRLTSLLLLLAGPVLAEDRYPFAGGIITRLDPETKQIALKTKTFAVTNTTYLLNGTERLTFDKLRVGDAVKLNYYTNANGRAVIRRLKIDHPPTDTMIDKTK